MRRVVTSFLAVAVLVVAAGFTSTASAALRLPQIAVAGGSLQAYLNGVGESINVNTDQNAVQTWQSTVSQNSTFTVQIELAGNAASNTLGIYNASLVAPPFYQVFPGAAAAGWFAIASFRSGPTRVIVNLFDQNAVLQGTNTYLGADATNFGYYLQGPGGTFYTQDGRNGGNAQALAYAGTGSNSGQWWLCWEDLQVGGGADNDYEDCVLFLESVNPTPVNKLSWGALKASFR